MSSKKASKGKKSFVGTDLVLVSKDTLELQGDDRQEYQTAIAAAMPAEMLPVAPVYDLSEDVTALLGDIQDELAIADQAQVMFNEALRLKELARTWNEKATELRGEFVAIHDQHDLIVIDISHIEKDIRDQLFSDPQIMAAVEALKNHPKWGQFTTGIEQRVVSRLAREAADLIAKRDELHALMLIAQEEWEKTRATANEYGAAGTKLFEERKAFLESNGFTVPEYKPRKEVKPTGK
jgi:hypothetical protein